MLNNHKYDMPQYILHLLTVVGDDPSITSHHSRLRDLGVSTMADIGPVAAMAIQSEYLDTSLA